MLLKIMWRELLWWRRIVINYQMRMILLRKEKHRWGMIRHLRWMRYIRNFKIDWKFARKRVIQDSKRWCRSSRDWTHSLILDRKYRIWMSHFRRDSKVALRFSRSETVFNFSISNSRRLRININSNLGSITHQMVWIIKSTQILGDTNVDAISYREPSSIYWAHTSDKENTRILSTSSPTPSKTTFRNPTLSNIIQSRWRMTQMISSLI